MSRNTGRYLRIGFVVLAVVLAGCSGGGGTPTGDTPAASVDDTSTGSNNAATISGEWTAQKNNQAIENSGSYTLMVHAEGVVARGNNITRTPNVTYTVKHDVETGEYVSVFGSTTNAYYPPNSDTVYTHYGDEVREDTATDVGSLTYTNLTSTQTGGSDLATVLDQLDATSGSTALGAANKYVLTDESAVDLPGNVSSEHGTVESYKQTIWLDKDTGVLAKFSSQKTIVDGAGDRHTLNQSFELSNLGSTSIETPEWVPDN